MIEYTINCVLHIGEPFSVTVPTTSSLTDLKKEIKKSTPLLNDFLPLQLTLYRVNIDTTNNDYIDEVKSLVQNPANLQEIHPLSLVGMEFPEQPDLLLRKIHILSHQQSPSALVDIRVRRRLAVTERATVETPPSTLARQFNTLPLSRFALHYPPTPDVIPLALLHPIFAEFVENVQLHNPTRADNEFARGLSDAMSKNYPLEAVWSHKFRDLLIDHYQTQLYAAGVDGTTRTTDGHAMVGQFMVIVCEGKERNRGGCPDVQGCLYWVEAIRKMVEVNDPLNVLPCIVISLFGPTIGFYGTVLTDRVQLEPLTDHFTLNLNHHEDFSRVARAFGALRIAFNKLCEYYQNLPTPRSPERVMFPYPDGWTANGDVELTYHSRVDKNRLIFLATTTNGAKVLVKFTRRYSEEVHQYCARAGVAPELLGFLPLPAGWYMVIMEYLDPETYRTLEPSDGSNNDLVAGIRQVVKTLHGGGFVHGDIRHVNILTRRSLEDAQNVFLIDFDWAGLEGKTRYPPNINLTSVVRPEGVEDGELIQQAHDWFMVEHIFCANKIWF